MAQAVRNLLASAKAPLLKLYLAVQEDYSACKARLEEVVTLLLTRERLPFLAPASPSCAPLVDHGGMLLTAHTPQTWSPRMMRHKRGVNVTHVSHKEGLKTLISPTEAILAWVAVLLMGALVISLLVADSFAFPLPTLIPALAQVWVA